MAGLDSGYVRSSAAGTFLELPKKNSLDVELIVVEPFDGRCTCVGANAAVSAVVDANSNRKDLIVCCADAMLNATLNNGNTKKAEILVEDLQLEGSRNIFL